MSVAAALDSSARDMKFESKSDYAGHQTEVQMSFSIGAKAELHPKRGKNAQTERATEILVSGPASGRTCVSRQLMDAGSDQCSVAAILATFTQN